MNVIELDDLKCSNPSLSSESTLKSFDKVNESELSYSRFFNDYLYTNTPCLIKNITENWKCQRDWVVSDKPNISFLRNNYGEKEAPVANCSERYYNSHTTKNMNIHTFMDYWEEYISSSYPKSMSCLYLKDWHFMKEFPEEDVYRVPKWFASDWLNEYFLDQIEFNDDYKFVYMGPKGSWTPLHVDVFSSFSWSVNICGKKKWLFFPPGQEKYLKDQFGLLAYDVGSKDLKDICKYPNYNLITNDIILIQEAGDAVFVPSGWHHQVWNLDDTISVNHNWVNGCNISAMWLSIQNHFKEVQKEIENCRDMDEWDDQCQIMLKASYGMNFSGFCDFLIFIADRRLKCLKNGTSVTEPGNWHLGKNHMIFDLFRIKPIFEEIYSLQLACTELHWQKISEILENIYEYI